MDKTIRRNTHCIIGQPRCDFVFSSTRTCFIGYEFGESDLEVGLLKTILEKHGIQPVEAGGHIAPGQNAFCAKICSKIITSQFCIILLNNRIVDGHEIPNANVNMEYGMMLAFNKYVVPFQLENQKLHFNAYGLDTVKYSKANFYQKATSAIATAAEETQQDGAPAIRPDQVLEAFLLAKRTLLVDVNNAGERSLYNIGAPLGFNLLNDFSGLKYIYFGNFTALRSEIVIWRAKMLRTILEERVFALDEKVTMGITNYRQAENFRDLVGKMEIWVLVTGNDEKEILIRELGRMPLKVEVFAIGDISNELQNIATSSEQISADEVQKVAAESPAADVSIHQRT